MRQTEQMASTIVARAEAQNATVKGVAEASERRAEALLEANGLLPSVAAAIDEALSAVRCVAVSQVPVCLYGESVCYYCSSLVLITLRCQPCQEQYRREATYSKVERCQDFPFKAIDPLAAVLVRLSCISLTGSKLDLASKGGG